MVEPERRPHAEFDHVADTYEAVHRKSIGASGEDPDYFGRYKVDVMKRILGSSFDDPVLDFGCGIGNVTEPMTRIFKEVHAFDPSLRSIEYAQARAPSATFFHEESALPSGTYGAMLLGNVLHHVLPAERRSLVAR